jgi:DNA-binding phage protein
MAQIAKELDLNREGLYVALSPQGNPSLYYHCPGIG